MEYIKDLLLVLSGVLISPLWLKFLNRKKDKTDQSINTMTECQKNIENLRSYIKDLESKVSRMTSVMNDEIQKNKTKEDLLISEVKNLREENRNQEKELHRLNKTIHSLQEKIIEANKKINQKANKPKRKPVIKKSVC